MTDKKQSGTGRPKINNSKLRDSSSKIIFADNTLSSQFLRDYADLDILRNIQPEDIEDVSERYVPLYSTERESDTVMRVDLSKYLCPQTETAANTSAADSAVLLELPLYIISLVEHKTKVEYNVIMQLLRYMVHIWEDYEKEMNKKHPGISSRKDFQYPPILPIVYYEGRERWTASFDLADRILCGDLLGKYLPHFRYQLIMLQEYSNADLLAKGDEISLAMLINKIQTPEDMSAFVGLPPEQMNGILRDTSDHLLEILARILRALLYNMNLPENEVEGAVAKIKERKMGKLFENVKMDIQAERRNAAEAREELAAIQEKMAAATQELDSFKQELDTSKQELDTSRQEQAVYRHISRMARRLCSDEEIVESLIRHFSLTREQAQEKLALTFEEE